MRNPCWLETEMLNLHSVGWALALSFMCLISCKIYEIPTHFEKGTFYLEYFVCVLNKYRKLKIL